MDATITPFDRARREQERRSRVMTATFGGFPPQVRASLWVVTHGYAGRVDEVVGPFPSRFAADYWARKYRPQHPDAEWNVAPLEAPSAHPSTAG